MPQIPILNGIYADPTRPDFRTAYPRNMVPVPKEQGISRGYLRPAEGVRLLNGATPGPDRGGAVWRGTCYRVMGTKLCTVTVDGVVTVLGDVGGTEPVNMDYSFDRIGFASDGHLWYSQGGAPFAVADADIGLVLDAAFIAGYWLTTDGEAIVATDLRDQMSVNPLRYGSSEVDPDQVNAIHRIRNEAYAVNRNTIEGFRNVGGTGFPFAVIQGAQVLRGSVGRWASCVFEDTIAFVGNGRDEAVGVYLASSGGSVPISTREVEIALEAYTDAQLATVQIEARVMRGHRMLYVHLPDMTLVYDAAASAVVEEPAWHVLNSGMTMGAFRARGFVLLNNAWYAGDPLAPRFGIMDSSIMTHYGDATDWEFTVPAIYNDGNPAIIHELELVALPGRVALGADPVIWTSFSSDGAGWSREQAVRAGKIGNTSKRIVWLDQGMVENWRVQRFRGTSDASLSFARLEARIEPLNRKRGNGI